jgi:hypothetical protein
VPDGYGASFGNILLDEHWWRKSDSQPLVLRPGRYSARVGVSLKPEAERTALAISKPFEFEIMSEEKNSGCPEGELFTVNKCLSIVRN